MTVVVEFRRANHTVRLSIRESITVVSSRNPRATALPQYSADKQCKLDSRAFPYFRQLIPRRSLASGLDPVNRDLPEECSPNNILGQIDKVATGECDSPVAIVFG